MQMRAGTWEAGREPGQEALKEAQRGGPPSKQQRGLAQPSTSVLAPLCCPSPGSPERKLAPQEAARAPGQPSRWAGLGQDGPSEPCVSASAPPPPPRGPALPTTPAPLPTQGHSTGSQG